eukprot:5053447-Amphidinium_carterae.1
MVCMSSHVQVAQCVHDLRKAHPALLWFVLKGPATTSGTRKDRSRAWHAVRLVREQVSLHGHVIMEANLRSNAWDQEAIEHLRRDTGIHTVNLKWCCLGVRVRDRLVSKTTRVLTTLCVPHVEKCECESERAESASEAENLGCAAVARVLCEAFGASLETEPESIVVADETMMALCAEPIGPSAEGEPKPETLSDAAAVAKNFVEAEANSFSTAARERQKERERAVKGVAPREKRKNLRGFERV